MSSAPLRSVRPGELADGDRAELVGLAGAARRSHDWSVLAGRLLRLRARGVPVAVLADAVGVGECRLRMVCRDHGPDPAALAGPVAEQGWVPTAAAAGMLGVGVARLLEHTADATADGVAVMAGWTRLWHGPTVPGWWTARLVDPRTASQRIADDRAGQVRALVAGGFAVTAAAAAVGVTERTAYRYLAAGRGR